jgi:hypothetical protein
VCVAPLQLERDKGKESTPSVGWEVPMKSQWFTSGESEGASMQKDVFSF